VNTGGLDIAASAVQNNRVASEQSWDDFWAELEKEEAAASAQSTTVEGDVAVANEPKEDDKPAEDNIEKPTTPQLADGAKAPAAAAPAKAKTEESNKTENSGSSFYKYYYGRTSEKDDSSYNYSSGKTEE
jgi:hypothetical protein